MSAPVIVVTGTDTKVGKTVTTAAIAAALMGQGLHVAVVKPTQTGLRSDKPGDVDAVARLVGSGASGATDEGDGPLTGSLETHEFVRLPHPLAPDAAARLAHTELPTVLDHAERIAELCERDDIDTVIVEGTGGLLVRLDGEGRTLADLAIALSDREIRVGFVLVVTAHLGTLNATALTAEALRARNLDLIGYVVGSYPEQPGLAEQSNLDDLPTAAGAQPLGILPERAAALTPPEFRSHASKWIHL